MNQMSKYILLVSVLLNGILIMSVVGMIHFFLYLSIIINLALVWYSITCLVTISSLEEDMVDLLNTNEGFLEELEEIHSLELYYGDEQLQHLINSSKELINNFIDVQEKYFDVEVEEIEYDEEDAPPPAEE